MLNCPVCDTQLDIEKDELDEGETITCEECGADLRVSSLEPLELEALEEDADEDQDEEDVEFDEEEDEDEDEEEEEDAEEERWK